MKHRDVLEALTLATSEGWRTSEAVLALAHLIFDPCEHGPLDGLQSTQLEDQLTRCVNCFAYHVYTAEARKNVYLVEHLVARHYLEENTNG